MQRGSDQWRHHYWGSPCDPTFATVTLGRARLRVDERIVEAVRALEEVLVDRHGYDVHPTYPTGDTGSYSCRHIGSDSSRPWSSHAWATAIDVNWNSNPDGSRLRTDIPPGAIRDIHRIRTKGGAPVWRWGGDWDRDPRTGHSYYDAMHFEIHATPAELETGVVLPDGTDTDPVPHITVRRGDRGATVAHLQDHLGIASDGIFGPQTEEAVVSFQRRAGLVDDGVVGERTWRALHKEEWFDMKQGEFEESLSKVLGDILPKGRRSGITVNERTNDYGEGRHVDGFLGEHGERFKGAEWLRWALVHGYRGAKGTVKLEGAEVEGGPEEQKIGDIENGLRVFTTDTGGMLVVDVVEGQVTVVVREIVVPGR